MRSGAGRAGQEFDSVANARDCRRGSAKPFIRPDSIADTCIDAYRGRYRASAHQRSPLRSIRGESFTARAGSAPRSVSLAWTISGGCLDMTGAIGGQFVAPMSSQNWVIPVHSPPPFYTDHPQRPAGSQQCLFRIHYSLIFNGVAPDGGAPRPAFTDVDNLNLC
jgi:hypothetical protein